MQLIRRLEDYRADAPLAVAIGNFDGLHRGHAAVLARMQAMAQEQQLVPAVLTFEPHPRQFFRPQEPAFRLQTLRDKLAGLRDAGVARVFAPKFDRAFASLSADDFLNSILRERMGVRAVITGENFAFGARRGGDVAMLRQWGAQQSIATAQVPPVMAEGDVCSSTAVRTALDAGAMAHAAALLARPYTISGRVRHGDKRGRALGFPTANLVPAATLKMPRYGIYVVRATVDGRTLNGVASLGVRPTVNPTTWPQLEVFFFDYAGDLYGKQLQVALLHHLRDEKRFDSLPALAHQMQDDARRAREFFSGVAA